MLLQQEKSETPVDRKRTLKCLWTGTRPCQSLPAGGSLSTELTEEDHEEGHVGSSSKGLPQDTVRLVVELLALVADPVDPTGPDDVEHLLSEVRDFLLSEGQLAPLIELVNNIRELMSERPQERDMVLGSFVSERALRRIITSIPKAQETVPEDLILFLDAIPSDPSLI